MRLPRKPAYLTSHDTDTMTPMIDVVFLLLVFFICASAGASVDQLVPIPLQGNSVRAEPQQPKAQPEFWNRPIVRIRLEPGHNGVAFLLNDQVAENLTALKRQLAALAAADAESQVILDIHDDVHVQDFTSIYETCQTLKFSNISFAVDAAGQ